MIHLQVVGSVEVNRLLGDSHCAIEQHDHLRVSEIEYASRFVLRVLQSPAGFRSESKLGKVDQRRV